MLGAAQVKAVGFAQSPWTDLLAFDVRQVPLLSNVYYFSKLSTRRVHASRSGMGR
jgi:hypothetical protein